MLRGLWGIAMVHDVVVSLSTVPIHSAIPEAHRFEISLGFLLSRDHLRNDFVDRIIASCGNSGVPDRCRVGILCGRHCVRSGG